MAPLIKWGGTLSLEQRVSSCVRSTSFGDGYLSTMIFICSIFAYQKMRTRISMATRSRRSWATWWAEGVEGRGGEAGEACQAGADG